MTMCDGSGSASRADIKDGQTFSRSSMTDRAKASTPHNQSIGFTDLPITKACDT